MNNELKNRLKAIVGEDFFLDSIEDRICYSYDATMQKYKPDVVLRPSNAQEISQIMAIANEQKIPVIPRGAGSGFSGGSIPVDGGILIDMTRFNRILEIDEDNLTVTVESGVITADLDRAVKQKGLYYPPDPSSMEFCTIGGNIAENAGGPRAFKYGVTKDFVMALEAVLPTGEIINTGARTIKSVTGYNFTGLLVGSEGTLAIITKAVLKLRPLPPHQVTLLANFDSVDKSAKTVSAIIKNKLIPSTIEFMDGDCIKSVEEHLHIGLDTRMKAMLLIELDGEEEEINAQLPKIKNICEKEGAVSLKTATDAKERDLLWQARRAVSPSVSKMAKTRINEDIAVPRSAIPEMLDRIRKISLKYNIPIVNFGHAGDGNIHVNIMTDESDKELMAKTHEAIEEILKNTIELNGTLSGEHGIGNVKAPYIGLEIGQVEIALMKSVKKVFDPNNILNPHKVFL